MDMSKLRSSTAVDKALGLKAVDKALRMDAEDSEQTRRQRQAQESALSIRSSELTADSVSKYLRGISESSTDELDALMSDLRGLREKLVDDGSRIEQNVLDFIAFNHSVVELTQAISDGFARLKATQPR